MSQGITCTVKPGDCISSLAYEHGLFWETVWNHAENSQLKQKRKNPNILCSGDEVFIPAKQEKQESCACEQKHRFRRKGVPAILRLQFLKEDEEPRKAAQKKGQGAANQPPPERQYLVSSSDPVEETPPKKKVPRANVPYVLDIDGLLSDGTTDSEGKVEIPIPPNAQKGTITLETGTERETKLVLKLGHLDPLDTVVGLKQRLGNLGYAVDELTEEETPALQSALAEFQGDRGLAVTGKRDSATTARLKEVHGS